MSLYWGIESSNPKSPSSNRDNFGSDMPINSSTAPEGWLSYLYKHKNRNRGQDGGRRLPDSVRTVYKLSAYSTSIRLCTSVDTHVLSETSFMTKCGRTFCTRIRLFTSVPIHVLCETLFLTKCGRTYCTSIRLFTSVTSHVPLKIRRFVGGMMANFTFE